MSDNDWKNEASRLLVGLKVVGVRYMDKDEAEDMGWDYRPVVIIFDNGLQVYPSSDDEGNNAGAMFTTDKMCDTLPVLR